MASVEKQFTPIGLLFEFFVPKDDRLVIYGIDALPLKQQLDILNPNQNNIHNEEARDTLILNLCEQLPDLMDSEDKRNRFRNILKLFHEEQQDILYHLLPCTQWTKWKIPFSFFCFFVNRLCRKPKDGDDKKEFEKEMQSAHATWIFIHYFKRFCNDKNWSGKELNDYFNEVTGNGIKPIQFGPKMFQLICNEYYDHRMRQFRKKLLRYWYTQQRAVKWQWIITALQHENPALSLLMQSVVEQIDDGLSSFTERELDGMIMDELKKRKLTFSEIRYIQDFWTRLREREFTNTSTENEEDDCDLDHEWSGLTKNLVRDIYSTHKVFMFGSFKFHDYSPTEFRKDVKRGEIGDQDVAAVFGRSICSDFVANDQRINALSLYPKWLIHDDLFQVMAIQFAVNLLVNELTRDQIGDGLTVHCFVVPQSVVSLYDHDVKFVSLIDDIAHFLTVKSGQATCVPISKSVESVEEMATNIRTLLQNAVAQTSATLLLFVDRRGNEQQFYILNVSKNEIVSILSANHCIGLRYRVETNKENHTKYIKSWLHFGENQSVRFWPEQLVWFLPRLFLMKNINGHDYLKRIYENDYRHALRTRLDDPVFNRYYKILTGYNHESVNYYRSESIQQRVEYQNYMGNKLNSRMLMFLDSSGYDSDAISADVADAVSGRTDGSNLIPFVRKHSESHLDATNTIMSLYQFTKNSHSLCTVNNALELWDCHFVRELIRNLRKFQNEKLQIDASNVSEFDISSVIYGLDHLVTVHHLFSIQNKMRIRSFISNQIRCVLGEECVAFSHQCSRRREKMINDSQQSTMSDRVESLRSVTMNNLSAAHCYLLHSDDVLYRQRGSNAKFEVNPFATDVLEDDNEEKKGDDGDSGAPISIDWGTHILEWLPFGVRPQFASFLEEMLKNPESTLNKELMEWCETECSVKIKEAESRGIVYTKDELLCLKLYSDTNDLQAAFRRAHWIRTPLDIKRNFYNWGITMYRTFLFHSVPTIELTLYHGLNQMFMVENLSPLYNGPFSTTSARSVAHSFSKGNGLLFTVGVNHLNPLKMVTGIDMKSISCHPNEHEVLLYSQTIPIETTQIFESDDEPLIDHLMFSLKKMEDPITNKMEFYRKIGIKFKKKWISLILNHHQLLSETKYGRRIVAHRLQHELKALNDRLTVKYLVQQKCAHLEMRSTVSLRVDNPLKVHVFGLSLVKRGVVDIECVQDIAIGSQGLIDAFPMSGHSKNGVKGGIIKLKSSTNITNGGKLCCDRSLENGGVDGIVYIDCDGAFINNIDGQIQCGRNGLALIRCSDFENAGYISSEPFIMINSATDSFAIEHLQHLHFWDDFRLVFNGSEITVHREKNDNLKWKISEFMFIVSVEGIRTGKEYIFDDIKNFQIPLHFPVWNQNGHFMTTQIYAKPKDGSFEYVPCKTVNAIDSIAPYKLDWNEPLLIDEELRAIDSYDERRNIVDIRCAQNIVIGTNGVIETQRGKESNQWKRTGLIGLRTTAHFANHGILRINGLCGGAISLFAVGGMRNDGIMECSAFSDNDDGGTIVMITDGEFVNNGVVDCGEDGMVIIECTEFVDNGSIAPRPNIVVRGDGMRDSLIQNMSSMNIEEPIKLTVRKHRGHCTNGWGDHHPQNLLKEGTGDRYSSFECGPPNEDWIVFEHDEESRFIPTTVIIRNTGDLFSNRGIKRIAIYGGNNIDDLEEWIEIDGIHRRNVERQIFPIGSRQRYIAYIEQFKYFKLRVLENHGGSWNEFHEFAIMSVKLL